MFLTDRIRRLITFLLATGLLALASGCAVKTNFSAVGPVALAKVDTDNLIQIRSVNFEGRLKKHTADANLLTSIVTAFAVTGDALQAKQDASYTDATLDIRLNSSIATRGVDMIKNVPLVSGYAMIASGNSVTYNWTTEVSFTLKTPDEKTIISEVFQIKGQDSFKPGSMAATALTSATQFTGASVLKFFYPTKEKALVLAKEILQAAGQEIAARLRRGEAGEYLIARTRERDGMSPKAYAEFQAKKERVKEQNAQRTADLKQHLAAQIDNKNGADRLGNGGLMVFGVGVDQYDNFPDLQYAASDCNNLVGWFRDTYSLSGDQATCLTNENASAIKVNRFLKRNAAQLLDENDTFVFYFSGHGAPEQSSYSRDGDGLNKYLLLSNTESDAMDMTAVNLNRLFETIDKLPAKRKIVLLDSCFSGEAGRTVLAGLKGISLSEKTYQNLTNISGKGTVILAASSENQLSQERADIGAGLFTHHLVNGLNGNADNNANGKVDILELFAYVTAKVDGASQGKQTPVLRGQLNRTIEF